MSKYYPPYGGSSKDIKVELDITNYATKSDLKDITHVDTSSFALKTNLSTLKTEIDKIDTDKSKTVPNDLTKLSNVVKNDVVKKSEYSKLKNKVDDIDTSTLETKITKVENKIPNVDNLAKKSSLDNYLLTTDFNSKANELEKTIKTNKTFTEFAGKKLTDIEKDLDGFKKTDLDVYTKKDDHAKDITDIKNDYFTRLKDLKNEHISAEIKKGEKKMKLILVTF